jgi:hypothetical protein
MGKKQQIGEDMLTPHSCHFKQETGLVIFVYADDDEP